jgi:thioredoxin-related protein
MSDYNKDYTALLLNCYVKKEKFQAISDFVNQDVGKDQKTMHFDVATAIEVCR